MSKSLRRYEILLPLRFNDGQPVPDDLVVDTLLELEQQFGAVSSETQTIRGLWRHEGESYRDDLIRVCVARQSKKLSLWSPTIRSIHSIIDVMLLQFDHAAKRGPCDP
jgi:hypothetical protein